MLGQRFACARLSHPYLTWSRPRLLTMTFTTKGFARSRSWRFEPPMRILLTTGLFVALACGNGALGQTATRLDGPMVKGRPIDHCADVSGANDCSAAGEAKAAQKACIENDFSDQAGAHSRPASGTAMHYVTEYDMHAGEAGGHWEEQPTSGTFDWIVC